MSIDFHTWPVILTYHSVSGGASPLCTPPHLFAEQMAWLAGSGHRVISLTELAHALRSKQAPPRRAVVLTFDDGFLDFYQAAFPVLRRFNFPATVFVVTKYCGRTNRWPGQPAWVEEMSLLGWQEIGEMAGQGITFGSHSATHPDLVRLDAKAAEEEVLSSQRELEARLGRRVDFFCYPIGRWNREVHTIVRQHYRGACGVQMARVRPDCDLFALPRIDAFYLRPLVLFRQLFTVPGSFYFGLRMALRVIRSNWENLVADEWTQGGEQPK